jgi:hypothetical protein
MYRRLDSFGAFACIHCSYQKTCHIYRKTILDNTKYVFRVHCRIVGTNCRSLTCVAAVVAPCDLLRQTKVRWVLGYLYNCNSSFTSFIYRDGQRLDGFYIICVSAVAAILCP